MKAVISIQIEEQYNDAINFIPHYNVNYLVTFPNEFGAYGEDFIELTGTLKPYHSGRDYDYQFEVSYFSDDAEENYYDENSDKIEGDILQEFYSNIKQLSK